MMFMRLIYRVPLEATTFGTSGKVQNYENLRHGFLPSVYSFFSFAFFLLMREGLGVCVCACVFVRARASVSHYLKLLGRSQCETICNVIFKIVR